MWKDLFAHMHGNAKDVGNPQFLARWPSTREKIF